MTLGEEPEVGKVVDVKGYEFTVSEVENIRINRIKIEKLNTDEDMEISSEDKILID